MEIMELEQCSQDWFSTALEKIDLEDDFYFLINI